MVPQNLFLVHSSRSHGVDVEVGHVKALDGGLGGCQVGKFVPPLGPPFQERIRDSSAMP